MIAISCRKAATSKSTHLIQNVHRNSIGINSSSNLLQKPSEKIILGSHHTRWSSSAGTTSNPSSNSTGGNNTNSKSHSSYQISAKGALGLASISLATGYLAGRTSEPAPPPTPNQERVLPSGVPRSCCSCQSATPTPTTPPPLTREQSLLPSKLAKLVGESNVISGMDQNSSNAMYLRGARPGRNGQALAIVTPSTLQEAINVLQATVDAGCVLVPQGANTGLTGGSVPRDSSCETNHNNRPTILLSTKQLNTMFPIDDGTKVLCLAGAGIATLSSSLPEWGYPDRESHSILGSMFLNPTTAAGVAFGSGGTQLRKGPAYTDRALYAKVHRNKWGENIVEVVNTLGIEGIEDEDFVNGSGTVVEQLDIYARDVRGGYRRAMANSSKSVHGKKAASDVTYAHRVCQCREGDEGVSRCNADLHGEDCNRSEGKVLILATVHDTFPKPTRKRTFWVSFEDFETALAFRREVCLENAQDLPVSVEYMDRDTFDVVDRSGRILANMIQLVGMTSFVITMLWNVKLRIEALPLDRAEFICDEFLHWLNNYVPEILPKRIMEVGRAKDHHVAMTIGDFGNGEMQRIMDRMAKFQNDFDGKIVIHECRSKREEDSISAFRFVSAPAFRTWCVGENVQGISVDYALPKSAGQAPPLSKQAEEKENDQNDDSAKETTPLANQPVPVKRMRYSHFGCNVVHEDLAYPLGVDVHKAKMALKEQVEHTCQGKLPAEHGHGTEYHAPIQTQERWKKMDPLNVMNPGIGGLSSNFKYQD